MKKIDWVVNVAIIAASIAVVSLAVKSFFFSPQQPKQVSALGKHLSSVETGISLTPQKTLVLVLSNTCVYCKKSIPFYQKLLPLAASHGYETAAIFPQSVADARAYLTQNGLTPAQVGSASLRKIPISGTPTLLVLDEKNVVIYEHSGFISDTGQNSVLNQLHLPTGQGDSL